MPGLSRTSKSTGLIGSGIVSVKNSYYCGVILVSGAANGHSDCSVSISDGKGNLLDYMVLDISIEGHSKAAWLPFPVCANEGIVVGMTGAAPQAIILWQEY